MSRTTTSRRRRIAGAAALLAACAALTPAGAGATPISAHQTYGADRYITSLVLEDWPLDTAFVVTGRDYPDGLTAAAVAGAMNANLYLSPPAQLTHEVRQRIGYAENIVLVGGEGALSRDITTWLQQNTRAKLHRIEGRDRYATAAAVARFGYPEGAGEVFVATGTDHPDALAASAAAAHVEAPVLLVTRDAVPAATAEALRALGPERITLLGGEGVVSEAVAQELQRTASVPVTRIHGHDRYETAAAVARRSFPAGADHAVVVAGTGWADAVSAGAYAGRHDAALLLTPRDCVPQSVNLQIEALGATTLEAVGGPAVLDDEARKRTSCGAGEKTYLDELPWPAGNARYASDHATIDGVFYPRSASFDTDPRNSEYRTWSLSGRYSRFTATVGLLDGNASGLHSTIDVYGDEKLLASRTVAAGASAALDVDVTGVENLKVVSTSSARDAQSSTDTVVYLGDAAVR